MTVVVSVTTVSDRPKTTTPPASAAGTGVDRPVARSSMTSPVGTVLRAVTPAGGEVLSPVAAIRRLSAL